MRAARQAALEALSRRDYSSGDLRRKLVDKGYEAALVAQLVERLVAEKVLDDRRYLENFVAYHAARGQGPNRVRAELRQAGLTGAPVDEALDAFPDWLGNLRKVRGKKFGSGPPRTAAEKRRQMVFLSYRGFTSAQIRTALGFDTDLDADNDDT
jgi:regulatory protein